MYKSKLQEYCHSKAWALPEYAPSVEGPPHKPRFKAAVTVNGFSFTTTGFCKSSKLAQNEAAKLAYEHFTGSSLPTNISRVLQGPLDGISHSTAQQTPGSVYVDETSLSAGGGERFNDQGDMCKGQLQIYAQKKNLPLPSYTTEQDGPPHARQFKSRVSINGSTYESPDFCKTVKQAENAAARVALMSLPSDGIQEVGSIFCKNVLQEFVQKEYSCLPKYSTSQSGPFHAPHFNSIVEIKGEIFRGQEAKTKKQSEMSAAMVAYAALKERGNKSTDGTNVGIIDYPKREMIKTSDIQGGDPQSALASPASITVRTRPNAASNRGATPTTKSSSPIVEAEQIAASNQEAIPPAGNSSHLYHDFSVATAAQISDVFNIDGTESLPSNIGRKVLVFPQGAYEIFAPGGAAVFHSDDGKWTAVTIGSNQSDIPQGFVRDSI